MQLMIEELSIDHEMDEENWAQMDDFIFENLVLKNLKQVDLMMTSLKLVTKIWINCPVLIIQAPRQKLQFMLEFCKLTEVSDELKTGVLTVYGEFLDDFDTKLQDSSDLDIGQFMNLMKIDAQNYMALILSGNGPLRHAMYQVIAHSHSLGLLHNTQAAYSYMIYMNDLDLDAYDKVVDLLKQDAPSVLDIDL